MMLMRVELYCNGLGGKASHGHIDIRVTGFNEDEAREAIISQVDQDFGHDSIVWGEVSILAEIEDTDFDRGDIYAVVVGGKGDALANNPVDKQFRPY